jgi:hypothetical protein
VKAKGIRRALLALTVAGLVAAPAVPASAHKVFTKVKMSAAGATSPDSFTTRVQVSLKATNRNFYLPVFVRCSATAWVNVQRYDNGQVWEYTQPWVNLGGRVGPAGFQGSRTKVFRYQLGVPHDPGVLLNWGVRAGVCHAHR